MSLEKFKPPIANKIPYELEIHNHTRVDNYYWLNQRNNTEVIKYIKDENDYYKKMTAHTMPLQLKLYNEMRGRIKEDDSSVPYFFNGYWYITRFEKNKDYPIYIRKKGNLKTKEEILFDCNVMAKGHEYFDLVSFSVSPDNTKVSFGVDTLSRRQYTIQVKDLITKKILKTKIKNTTGGSVWANDNKSLFYNIKNPITLRSEAVLKHDISFPNREG